MKLNNHKTAKSSYSMVMLILVFLLSINLAGCSALDIPWFQPKNSPVPGVPTSETDLNTPETALTQTPTPEAPPESLTIWLPPEMDIESDLPEAALLRTQLESFSKDNNDIEIKIRIKEVSGAGGLLDALIATSLAAPSSLPDLIALPRKDLETAALKSLVFPIDGLTSIVDEPDWYPYSKEMALIQGVAYGVPFFGDSLVLAYRTDVLDTTPTSWDTIVGSSLNFGFAADDPGAALTLALYQAAGGPIQDNQRRPTLDAEILTEVLKFFAQANDLGKITPGSMGYQTEAQAYQAFSQGDSYAVVVSLVRYLNSAPENTSIIMIPPLLDKPASGSSGWVWAVATPKPIRQVLAVKLAEALVEPFFLSGWSQALGKLPARPSSMEAWVASSYKPLLNQISMAGIMKPTNDISGILGPILRDATMQVLTGKMDPAQAAEVAKESLQ